MNFQLDRRHFLGGSAALASAPALARTNKQKRVTGNWDGVQSMLDDTVKRKYVPGVGAALARGAGPAVFLTAGTLSFDSQAAITPDTLWRVYSMTKPVTGIGAMLLIEDGKMSLDQNVADFLPAFGTMRVLTDPDNSLESRPAKSPMTIRSLLTHTAGLGYTIVTKGPLKKEYERLGINPAIATRKKIPVLGTLAPTAPSLAEFADRLATLPLVADPGLRWSYSVSLDLLGRVIEVASGMSFDAFLQKRIFDPLGMRSTWWQVPESEKHRLTSNYAAIPGGKPFELDPGPDSIYLDRPAFPFGGAGLVCSMRDYDRFLAMLMGMGAVGRTRIMKPETARLAMSNLVHPDTIMEGLVKGQGFGAGGRVTISDDPQGSGVGTFGWGGAASTIGWVDPTRKLRASGWSQIMTQGEQVFVRDFGKAVYASR